MSNCNSYFQCLIAVSVLLSVSFNTYGQSVNTDRIDSLFNHYQQKENFSGNVLLAEKGVVIYSKSVGTRNFEGDSINQDTKFLIGSLTKSFTSILVQQQIENGNIHLNTPLSNYFPWIKSDLKSIPIRAFLNMNVVLPNHLDNIIELKHQSIDHTKMIKVIDAHIGEVDSTNEFIYSNLNYHILSSVLCEVLSMEFDEILSNYIFNPLQMDRSGSGSEFYELDNVALGKIKDNQGKIVPAAKNYIDYAMGSGDIYASINDLFLFARALFDRTNPLLNIPDSMIVNPPDSPIYSNGFKYVKYMGSDKQGLLVRNGGSMYGYLTTFHHYLEDDITLIICTNMRPFPIMNMVFDIKEIYFNKPAGRINKHYKY